VGLIHGELLVSPSLVLAQRGDTAPDGGPMLAEVKVDALHEVMISK